MENEEEIMNVVKILYDAFQLNGINPQQAVHSMVYMISAIVQLQTKNPREILCLISQDFLNISQAVGKDAPEVKED